MCKNNESLQNIVVLDLTFRSLRLLRLVLCFVSVRTDRDFLITDGDFVLKNRPPKTACGYCCSHCWRALARQLPILYNREKKAKSVGCKIGDLRSKFAFNIRGLLNVGTCAVDYECL